MECQTTISTLDQSKSISLVCKRTWIFHQRFTLNKHGTEGFGLKRVLTDMFFAAHRFDQKFVSFENICLTFLASCCAISEEANNSNIVKAIGVAKTETSKLICNVTGL